MEAFPRGKIFLRKLRVILRILIFSYSFEIDYDEYTDSGFLALQRCIDQEFIDSVRDQTNHDIQVNYQNQSIFLFIEVFLGCSLLIFNKKNLYFCSKTAGIQEITIKCTRTSFVCWC